VADRTSRAWLAAALAIPLMVTPALLALPDTGLPSTIAAGAAALVMGGAVAWIEATRPTPKELASPSVMPTASRRPPH
jgi:hypothetical protein